MAKRLTRKSAFSDQLRQQVETCGMSRYELAMRTGIDQASLSRFVSGERGLPLKALDKLAALLDWEVVIRGRGKP